MVDFNILFKLFGEYNSFEERHAAEGREMEWVDRPLYKDLGEYSILMAGECQLTFNVWPPMELLK